MVFCTDVTLGVTDVLDTDNGTSALFFLYQALKFLALFPIRCFYCYSLLA